MRLPPNYGSVYKLKGNRRNPWVARVHKGKTEEGRPIREILGYFPNQKEALQTLADYHKSPETFANNKLTFKDVYDKLMPEHLEGKSDSLKRIYRSGYNSFSDLHNMKFADVKAYHIEPIIKNIECSEGKKRHMVSLLSLMYKYALKMEITTVDRSKNINIGKVKEKKDQKIYTELEIKRLWKDQGNLVADILLILLHSGMRISELLNMEKRNVYLNEGYMIGGSKTDAGMERIIPIHNNILPMIVKYYNKSTKHLIEKEDGNKLNYSSFKYIYVPYKEEKNLTNTVHQTRHTFITKLNEAGVDDYIIKLIVGHAQQDITKKVYTHVKVERLIEAVNLLA